MQQVPSPMREPGTPRRQQLRIPGGSAAAGRDPGRPAHPLRPAPALLRSGDARRLEVTVLAILVLLVALGLLAGGGVTTPATAAPGPPDCRAGVATRGDDQCFEARGPVRPVTAMAAGRDAGGGRGWPLDASPDAPPSGDDGAPSRRHPGRQEGLSAVVAAEILGPLDAWVSAATHIGGRWASLPVQRWSRLCRWSPGVGVRG
jgi:hypothetical protein